MFLRHSFFYLLAKIIPALASFITLAAYTRMLTPSEFGVYTILLTAVNFANTVLFYWLVISILRYWQDLKNSRIALLSTTINIYLLIIFVAFVLLVTAYYTIPALAEVDIKLIVISFILLITLAFFDLGQQARSANLDSDKYAVTEVTRIVASIIVTLPLLWFGFGILSIFIGFVLANLLTLILFSKKVITYQPKTFDKEIFSQIWAYGLPLSVVIIMGQVIDSSDRFLLSYLVDAKEAGMYAVGYNLPLQAIMTIASTLNLAAYPMILKAYNDQGEGEAKNLLEKYFLVFISLMIPTVIGLILVGPNLINIIIGESFQQAAIQLLPWISIAILIFVTKAFVFDLVFHITKKTKVVAGIATATAVLNIILNLWLIPQYGFMGAVYATMSAYVSGIILSIILSRSLLLFATPFLPILKIALAAGVMALVLLPIRDYQGITWLIAQSLLGAMVYGAMALLLDIPESRGMAKKIMEKIQGNNAEGEG